MTVRDLKYELQNLEDSGYGDYVLSCELRVTDEELTTEKVDLLKRVVELS